MIKKIERPDWTHEEYSRVKLKRWFDKHIEPINAMLEGAVEVYANVPNDNKPVVWVLNGNLPDETHKALLINIEPIKKQTREERLEDVLRRIVENHEDEPHITELYLGDLKDAKQALEGGENGD